MYHEVFRAPNYRKHDLKNLEETRIKRRKFKSQIRINKAVLPKCVNGYFKPTYVLSCHFRKMSGGKGSYC